MYKSENERPSRDWYSIFCRLQVEEQAKEQCQSFQTGRQANQLAQSPIDKLNNIQRQYKLNQLDIQVNEVERDLEYNLMTREIYPRKAEYNLQKVEEENLMGYSHTGKSLPS